MILSREATDVPGVTEDLRSEDRADAEELDKGRLRLLHSEFDRSRGIGDPTVERSDVGDDVERDPSAYLLSMFLWALPAELCRLSSRRTAQVVSGAEDRQERLEPIDGASALSHQVVAPIGEHPQNRGLTLRSHLVQAGGVSGGDADGDGVRRVVLPPIAH